jgi:hypothetical protein
LAIDMVVVAAVAVVVGGSSSNGKWRWRCVVDGGKLLFGVVIWEVITLYGNVSNLSVINL